ncbi:hypothetical protein G159_04830 [Planococcus glaciei CHR43]|nr:hypothetical protein G159_04830 [Planococcus glaciei CHR43]
MEFINWFDVVLTVIFFTAIFFIFYLVKEKLLR